MTTPSRHRPPPAGFAAMPPAAAARGGLLRALVAGLWAASVLLLSVAPASAAPNQMTRAEILAIAKTIPGFSYWWGGAKWKPGDLANKGSCSPNAGSSGCPDCSHKGLWGADCSGFVGKAWQIDKPTALETYYHPYSTSAFKSQSTWWNHIKREQAQQADAFNYNTNGAGHIFLYDKGDPWKNVWAWECAGCKTGCVYNLRPVSSSYEALQRKLLKADTPTCAPHCEGAVMVDATCGKGDCSKFGAKCVNDAIGLRCVFAMCPDKGSASICLPDGKLGACKDGQLTQSACAGAQVCEASSATAAACVKPCPASCDDGNACTADSCDAAAGACSHKPTGSACDDGDACTSGDACAQGACKPGKSKPCDDGKSCTADSCDSGTGACDHAPTSAPCDDGDACTSGDACAQGACKPGKPKPCDDGKICTKDTCDAGTGACGHAAHPGACDDGNPCSDDACVGATCHHFANSAPCGEGKVCAALQCVDAASVATPPDGGSSGRSAEADGQGGQPAADGGSASAGSAHGADAARGDSRPSGGAAADSGQRGGVGADSGAAAPAALASPAAPSGSGCSAGGSADGGAAPLALLALALASCLWRRRLRDAG